MGSQYEQLNVVAFCGSLRKGSYNRKALEIAKKIAEDAGATVTEADLREFVLPLYDGDIEAEGFPEPVQRLQDFVEPAHVLLIASPEYSNSVSGVLKNALDWLSRPPRRVLRGKIAAIFGASPGMGGTTRGQLHLRQILRDCGVLILPTPEVVIRSAAEAFTPDGQFIDLKTHELLETLITKTLETARRLLLS